MTAGAFTVIVVYNTMDPRDHTAHSVPHVPGLTVGAYLRDLPPGIEWGAALNGEALAPEGWGNRTIGPTDTLIIMPIPEGGGGGGKTVLRLVAMIAIAALAAQTGGAAAGWMVSEGIISTGSASIASAVAGGVIPAAGCLRANSHPEAHI